MDIQRILVGTDVSENALVAVDNAAAIARRTGAKLVLVYATPYVDPKSGTPTVLDTSENEAALTRMHLEDAKGELEWLAARCGERGVPVNTEVLTALPAEGLVDEAGRINADLIVVGTHGYTGFQRLLLGSVAERVVRGAQTSVMVARHKPPEDGFRRILVATDFSDTADLVMRTAKTLVAPGGDIEVLHCWQPPLLMPAIPNGTTPAFGAQLETVRADVRAEVTRRADALLARHQTDRATLSYDSIEDSAARGIQARLAGRNYDCAIVGSHGRRGVKRWLLGSVAEQTVRYSPCTTVVVKPAPD